ncbi:transcriptional regulator [Pseudoclavibacter endophyticus]|uniref:PadR family transcriptional regulator n=1 Tax=Pseudoclavibacter endophyticus TaxID=1778590 RepID=A0A6H9WQP9_9MICO|nr:PadR family transcriptional regulator [Pseudoclavibacter endophyticus]KAB1648375.1 PadR family transcriptional regulator [Pseudoclavibacter endophyticus]GGA72175.1 transcriptional regulator [Pseudoclavibacter endophyticus]
MSLRAALLFVLASEPLTGYDAAKRFGTTVGHLWHAADSQIYPELHRMEDEGLIEGADVPWGAKGATKREYSITRAGLEFLGDWQARPLRYAPERDPARLRSAYFEWAAAADARAQLLAHIAHHEREIAGARARIHSIRDGENDSVRQRLGHYAPADRERVTRWKVFAHEGTIARAEAEIAWARRGIALLEDDPESPAAYRPAATPDVEPVPAQPRVPAAAR